MTDMPNHGHPDGSTHLGRYCGDCPDDHRAFLAAQYNAEQVAEEADPARQFIQSVAQNGIVADDFTEGNEAFNELVRAARALADELGITYQPGEGPEEEEISAEEYEAWPGNQPGGTATGGSP